MGVDINFKVIYGFKSSGTKISDTLRKKVGEDDYYDKWEEKLFESKCFTTEMCGEMEFYGVELFEANDDGYTKVKKVYLEKQQLDKDCLKDKLIAAVRRDKIFAYDELLKAGGEPNLYFVKYYN